MIRLIAAIDRQRGLAKHGFQPWYIPDDEKYFTEQTKQYGGNVLVGKITFQTFKGPLADRQNYVLTHGTEPIAGATVVNDLMVFLSAMKDKDVWVVGGAQVFKQVLDAADELYITHVEADFGCDQWFPDFSTSYDIKSQSELHEQNGFIYKYAIYSKK